MSALGVNTKFIVSALRRAWMRSPERRVVKARALIQGTKLYLCGTCRRPKEKVEIDHVDPVGSPNGPDGWAGFIARLFCEPSGLRVLCTECHRARTNAEQATRQKRPTVQRRRRS